jgi:CRP/FNR family transcriptional regulator, nitrogen oxide reductase regulator
MGTISSPETSIQLYQRIPLFAGMTERELGFLAQNTRLDKFKPEEVIFYQGDECSRVFLLQLGRVKIVYHEVDGREVILELINPGEVFGGTVLFFPHHPATAKAIEDCGVLNFSREIYAEFIQNHPKVALKLLSMLGTRHLSMINMQIMAGERVEIRMAHILLKLADRIGKTDENGVLITIPFSRQDLADMSCTTLETAIRTISRFNKQGLVETRRGGYLLIKDVDGLEQLTHINFS